MPEWLSLTRLLSYFAPDVDEARQSYVALSNGDF
jgi:hypothetical protein